MKIKKVKTFIMLIFTSFILIGCNKNTEKITIEINSEEDIKINDEENLKSQTSDEIINNYLLDLKTKLKSEDYTFETLKEKITSSFITLVDFIFYEKDINGVTFDELTQETKNNVFESFLLIDAIIDKNYPDYKNNLSEKYADLKYKISDYTLEKIGPENFEKIKEAKENFSTYVDLLKDVTEDITDSEKIKIKSWYEQFRDNKKTP